MARVLVVDDELDIRELVRLNLEFDDHEVILAENGAEAVEMACGEHPDVIVLDVMMPVLDGFGVLSELKASPDAEVAEIPIIMLTARNDDLDRIRGGIEGAIRYLTKPFSPGILRDEVKAAVAAAESEPVRRRQAQSAALEELARLERGATEEAVRGPRPHLTRLERRPGGVSSGVARPKVAQERLDQLSDKQRELLGAVAGHATVTDAAERLGVSRSNVYASLRRIARRLDVRSVPELITLARAGSFDVGS